jgi:hypothetical protein
MILKNENGAAFKPFFPVSSIALVTTQAIGLGRITEAKSLYPSVHESEARSKCENLSIGSDIYPRAPEQ